MVDEIFVLGNINIVGPLTFRGEVASEYVCCCEEYGYCGVCCCCWAGVTVVLQVYYVGVNRARERGMDSGAEGDEGLAFADVTDRKNKAFRYRLRKCMEGEMQLGKGVFLM